MKNWINNNYKTLIIAAFLIPIITVAIVSISHVTTWYGISNPVTWSVYLSIGIEIAALAALAAISANMGSKVYFPFAIVTLIQFIGNIFFAYTYIDINSQLFKDWVDLVSPLVEIIGVEPGDMVGHKRFLALFAGGMLPIISLSFLHMLVKFTEEDRMTQTKTPNIVEEIVKEEVEKEEVNDDPVLAEFYEKYVKEQVETQKVDAKDIIGEVSRLRLSDKDLKRLEEVLINPPLPNDNLKQAYQDYKDIVPVEDDMESASIEEEIITEIPVVEEKEEIITEIPVVEEKEEIVNDTPILVEDKTLNLRQVVFEPIEETKTITQEERAEILSEIMKMDQELGLYDEPTPTQIEPVVETKQEIYPALSDEEVREMFMDEWEKSYELVDDEGESFETEPTVDEEEQNFNLIEPNEITEVEIPKDELEDNTPNVDTNIVSEEIEQPSITEESVEKKN